MEGFPCAKNHAQHFTFILSFDSKVYLYLFLLLFPFTDEKPKMLKCSSYRTELEITLSPLLTNRICECITLTFLKCNLLKGMFHRV